jgi:type I restriction enzyme S subunit
VTELPVSWARQPLGNLVEFLDHKRVPIKEADRSTRRGPYPYYGASGVIDSIDEYLFDEELILVGEDGANVLDRSSPLAFKVSGKIWVNNHAHVLRVRAPNNIDYLVDYLESISYRPYVTGTAQPKLNKAALSGVPVPVPPSEEQIAIAAIYAQFLESKGALARELRSLGNLHRITLASVGETYVQ